MRHFPRAETCCGARVVLAWANLRNLNPLAVKSVALIMGIAAGYGWGRWERAESDAVMAGDTGLRLETELNSSQDIRRRRASLKAIR